MAADSSQLWGFEERFGLLVVDRQWSWERGARVDPAPSTGQIQAERGVVEDIDYQHPDAVWSAKLMPARWPPATEVRVHHNILFIRQNRAGGSPWLASPHWRTRPAAMASVALHKRIAELFRELAVARADGSFGQYLLKLSRIDVLVLDDFAMAPLKEQERRDFLEICDDRYQRRSTILTSQVPVAHWHESRSATPASPTASWTGWCTTPIASELDGESMRKLRGRKPPQEPPQ